MPMPTVHPGKVLLEELLERDWTLTGLANDLHLDRDHLRDLLLGMEPLTDDLANRIGALIGSGPEFWMNLQHNHDSAATATATAG